MADGQVVFEIKGDNKPIKESLNETTSAIQRESKNWDSAVGSASNKMSGSFTNALKGMGAAVIASGIGKALLDFGKQAIGAASDLSEVQNVVDVTFGDSAGEIDAWAKNAINQFGLTETKAKQFASTLGAMMKSSGVASESIMEMSTSLAGLAADMASFYNLDFDEAFQKIRSGISGETEPLKQLGINMSVANLEAYALSQGIETAFDKMSQGEQIMLRYQYMMQATSDAQGDFARTSDGMANGLRLLESNFEQLKTAIGTALMPVVESAIQGLNSLMGALIPEQKQRTILDDFRDIDLRTEQKVTQIEETANKASDLLKVLEELQGMTISSSDIDLGGIADGANRLNTGTGTIWSQFIKGLDGVDTLITDSSGGKNAGNELSGLADGGEKLTGTAQGFKYENLPIKIQELMNKAGLSGDIVTGLGEIDEEGKKMTGTSPGKFKYADLTGDINDLHGATDNIQTINQRFAQLDQKGQEMTGTSPGGFKYANVTEGISALKDAADDADGINGDLETLNEKGGEMSKTPSGGWKFSNVTAGVSALDAEAGKADSISKNLETIQEGVEAVNTSAQTDNVGTLANSFKLLDSTHAGNWQKVLGALKNVPGLNLDTGKIDDIVKAFSGLGGDKAAAWQSLMDALGSDLSSLATLTGQDEAGAAQWLADMKEAANGLNPADVDAWNALFTLLTNGVPGAENFLGVEDMQALARAAGMSEDSIRRIGDSAASAGSKQQEWLEVCRRLVQTIPELSQIINTETGEIKGGIQAVGEYIEAWKQGQKELAYWNAHFEKENKILADTGIMEADLEVMRAQAKLDRLKAQSDAWLQEWERRKAEIEAETDNLLASTEYAEHINQQNPYTEEVAQASEELEKAFNQRTTAMNAYNQAVQDSKDEEEGLIAAFGQESREIAKGNKELNEGAGAAKNYSDAQKKAASDGVTALTNALKELNDYVESTRKSTQQAVDNSLNQFGSMIKGSDYLQQQIKGAEATVKDLQDQIREATKGGKGTLELEVKLTGAEQAIPSMQNLTKTLKQQLEFIQEYQTNLQLASDMGYDSSMLAELADGSQESAATLAMLVQATDKERDALNAAYVDVKNAKGGFVDSLTEMKLKGDETFNELVKKAEEAAQALNQNEAAKDSMAATVKGIADGIKAKISEVAEAVDALNAELARMGSVGGGGLAFGNGGASGGFSIKFGVDGSNAKGLEYVPFDNYLSYLHEGEAVLTAEEAAIWRNFKNGGANIANSIDYGALSGAIWDKAPSMGGGNVYLDGRTVGKVISAQQANGYRSLERSGWRA